MVEISAIELKGWSEIHKLGRYMFWVWLAITDSREWECGYNIASWEEHNTIEIVTFELHHRSLELVRGLSSPWSFGRGARCNDCWIFPNRTSDDGAKEWICEERNGMEKRRDNIFEMRTIQSLDENQPTVRVALWSRKLRPQSLVLSFRALSRCKWRNLTRLGLGCHRICCRSTPHRSSQTIDV